MHLDLDQPIPFAFLAASAFDIKAESTGMKTADLRCRQSGEQVADVIKHAGVSRRVAAGRAPDWSLIDDDHLVQILNPIDCPVRARFFFRTEPSSEERPAQDIV